MIKNTMDEVGLLSSTFFGVHGEEKEKRCGSDD